MPPPPNSAPAKPRSFRWYEFAAVGVATFGLGVLIALNADPAKPTSPPEVLDVDDAPPELVAIPGGTFVMGTDDGPDDERPAHEVTVSPFQIGRTEVTNGQFAKFVQETGYKTVAERVPDLKKYPGADPKNLVPGSAVYVPVQASTDPRTWATPYPPWWAYRPGANWLHPDGPDSNLVGKKDHPVVHIAWEDAVAFCMWSGTRLPTEAEWEYAARGGLAKQPFAWGSAKQGDGGKWYANAFQGSFPDNDTGADGFAGRSPVKSFPPNGFGLYDVSGNAWEWCSDNYAAGYYAKSPKADPKGPEVGDDEGGQPLKVRRGGSYLCDDSYCRRYLPSARDKNPADSSASHTGFRVAKGTP